MRLFISCNNVSSEESRPTVLWTTSRSDLRASVHSPLDQGRTARPLFYVVVETIDRLHGRRRNIIRCAPSWNRVGNLGAFTHALTVVTTIDHESIHLATLAISCRSSHTRTGRGHLSCRSLDPAWPCLLGALSFPPMVGVPALSPPAALSQMCRGAVYGRDPCGTFSSPRRHGELDGNGQSRLVDCGHLDRDRLATAGDLVASARSKSARSGSASLWMERNSARGRSICRPAVPWRHRG